MESSIDLLNSKNQGEIIYLSKYLNTEQTGNDKYVIWNTYSPSILKLNAKGVDFINLLKKQKVQLNSKNKELIETLIRYKIVSFNSNYNLKVDFCDQIQKEYQKVCNNIDRVFQGDDYFEGIAFVNNKCNLQCSYCIKYHQSPCSVVHMTFKERCKIISKAIDQFFQKKNKNKVTHIPFNGGEFLLDWNLFKFIVEYVRKKHSDYKVEFSLNSNLTIMTDEIALFLNKYHINVHISIDGYRQAHDRTRVYHDGKGSYDDIVKNLKLLRKYPNIKIQSFQGTIADVNDFDVEEVYKMKELEFESARLAPNLLNISDQDACQKAMMMGKFLELNASNDFKVLDSYFTKFNKVINSKDYKYFPYCRGLCAFPRMELTINVSDLSISLLCSFINNSYVRLKDIEYNIYNKEFAEVIKRFINHRMESYLKYCINCKIVALCRGGCIYSGLDKKNNINLAACIYQNELWKIYLKSIV